MDDQLKVKLASIILGRKSPTNKYLMLGIEIGLLSQHFGSKPPKGLCPTMYHTGSYKGDMEQYEKLVKLVDRVIDEYSTNE